jgi:ATP-dependent Clp protease ATP-binding subunit ClpC
MFERYTESARRVLFFARYEASQFGSTSIETDHVLLGLTREAKGIVCEVFALSHVSLKSIRHEIETRAQKGEKISTSVEIPFTDETKRVLGFTAEEADRLQHRHIGTEHVLLGLLREGTSSAATTLTEHGLRLEDVRAQIVTLSESRTTAHTGEAFDQVEQIKRLVGELAGEPAEGSPAARLVNRILRDLDSLKRRLGD